MLLKSKICFTVLAVYEMLAVSVLHFQRVCDAMFPTAFCDSWYRYFLFCVIVPLVAMIILMWLREIVRAHRRRTFIRRAKNALNNIMGNVRSKLSEHLDIQDIEKLIAAAILIGIKRYADRHPDLHKKIKGFVNASDEQADMEIMSAEIKRPSAKKRVKPTVKLKKSDVKKKK